MAAHQAPPSLGFSRQEHWSVLPFPSPMHESEKWKWSRSVMSETLSDPMDCSPPGSSIHGIFQARVLECYSPENVVFFFFPLRLLFCCKPLHWNGASFGVGAAWFYFKLHVLMKWWLLEALWTSRPLNLSFCSCRLQGYLHLSSTCLLLSQAWQSSYSL